jgi:hypothetical protein
VKKSVIALMAAFALMLTIAAPTTADAQGRAERQFFRALGVGAAVVGGALLFGAAARAHMDPRWHQWAPADGYYYVDGPRYYAAPPAPCPDGFWAYRINSRGQPYGNPRWVCPPRGYYASHYVYRR